MSQTPETKPTPGPWNVTISAPDHITHDQKFARIMAGEVIIAQCEKPFPYGAGFHTEANARYIVKACNSHEALLEALVYTLEYAKVLEHEAGRDHKGNATLNKAREALAKAKGE